MSLSLVLTAIVIVSITAVVLSYSNANAIVLNLSYFGINTPINWAYKEGYASVALTPIEFGELLLDNNILLSSKLAIEGALSEFRLDTDYQIKNAGLDLYAKYKIDGRNHVVFQVTSTQNTTIDNETALKIYADGINEYNGTKFVEYFVMYNNEPYHIGYVANVKDYEKYLPEFEQTVKTFRFIPIA